MDLVTGMDNLSPGESEVGKSLQLFIQISKFQDSVSKKKKIQCLRKEALYAQHMYKHMYIHKHMYMYMHKHMYTHKHMYMYNILVQQI